MRPLPLDYSRCSGRMGLSPKSAICSQRDTCMRYISFSQLDLLENPDNYRNISVTMAVENCWHKIEIRDDSASG